MGGGAQRTSITAGRPRNLPYRLAANSRAATSSACKGRYGRSSKTTRSARHGALHGRHELSVDEGHAGSGFTCPRHDASAIQHPPRLLVPAVGLVQDLQQVAGGRAGCRRGPISRGVPERERIVFERFEPVRDLRQAGADVAERERGPVREVVRGCRAVTSEIAQRQRGERLEAVEPWAGWNSVGEPGVGVGAVGGGPAAADEGLELEVGEEDRQRLAADLPARVGQDAGQLGAGQVRRPSASSTTRDTRSTARSSIPWAARSCCRVVRRTRGAVSSISQATSSAAT